MWGRWGCVSSVCGVSPSRSAGVCRRADPEPDAELASPRRFLTVTPGLNRPPVHVPVPGLVPVPLGTLGTIT